MKILKITKGGKDFLFLPFISNSLSIIQRRTSTSVVRFISQNVELNKEREKSLYICTYIHI